MGRADRGLLVLGLAACLRAAWLGDDALAVVTWGRAGEVPAAAVGTPVPLALEGLSGSAWRLLPGVGPVLAGRLEAARVAAGGSLDEAGALEVAGVGPRLVARWRRLCAP